MNKNFVDKQRGRGDCSVGYSIYMRMSWETFNETYSITELEYTHNVPDIEGKPKEENDFSVPDPFIKALDVPLGSYDDLVNVVKMNDYVVYAAIDLVNAEYTSRFERLDGSSV